LKEAKLAAAFPLKAGCSLPFLAVDGDGEAGRGAGEPPSIPSLSGAERVLHAPLGFRVS
jgi:hypothetical protein